MNPAILIPSLFIVEETPNFIGESETATLVLSLVEPLLAKWHTLWMDNYNAPALATTKIDEN